MIYGHDEAKNVVCLSFEELEVVPEERDVPHLVNRSKINKALNIAFIDMDVMLVPRAPMMSEADFADIAHANINLEPGVYNYRLTAHQEWGQDKYNAYIDENGKIILRPRMELINNGGLDAGVTVHLKIEGVVFVKEMVE